MMFAIPSFSSVTCCLGVQGGGSCRCFLELVMSVSITTDLEGVTSDASLSYSISVVFFYTQ